jgi:hypothetical protein
VPIAWKSWVELEVLDSITGSASSNDANSRTTVTIFVMISAFRGSVAPTMELSEPRDWPVGWTWQ